MSPVGLTEIDNSYLKHKSGPHSKILPAQVCVYHKEKGFLGMSSYQIHSFQLQKIFRYRITFTICTICAIEMLAFSEEIIV